MLQPAHQPMGLPAMKIELHNNQITRLHSEEIVEIGDWFLCGNRILTSLSLPSVKRIGDWFLYHNPRINRGDYIE